METTLIRWRWPALNESRQGAARAELEKSAIRGG